MDTGLAALAVAMGMVMVSLFCLRIAGLYPRQRGQEGYQSYDDGLMRIVGVIGFFFLTLGARMLVNQYSPEMVGLMNWFLLLALLVLVFGIRSGLNTMEKAKALPCEEEQGL